MNNISNKKKLKIIFLFIILDILTIYVSMFYIKPDSSAGIVLIFLIPLVFFFNLIVAGLIYFVKRYYSYFFVLNAFISVFLLIIIFNWATKFHVNKYMDSWEFSTGNITYDIFMYEDNNTFWVTSTTEFGTRGLENDRGIVQKGNDTIYFSAVDSAKFYIYDNYIYNFKDTDKVKVKKKY